MTDENNRNAVGASRLSGKLCGSINEERLAMCDRKEFERMFKRPTSVKFKRGEYVPLTKNGDYIAAADYQRIWNLYRELADAKTEIVRLQMTHNA